MIFSSTARLTQRLARWQNRVREPSLTVLFLEQVVLLFVASPLVSAGALAPAVVDALQVVFLLTACLALPQGNKVRLFILLCLPPMLWVFYAGATPYVSMLLLTVAILGITVAVGQAVFRARRITRHQLLGAVVVYLNLALLFMGAFIVLDTALPGAFTAATHTPLQPGELLYFSLTTITSTGYGDILPVHPLARSLANLEGVLGQLFLAILLARLVSLHGTRE